MDTEKTTDSPQVCEIEIKGFDDEKVTETI
jgi:hypothetical protein